MYDFIIIGGGTSGLSAAMYAARLGLKTLALAEMPGGLITTTNLVENWPGIKSISGPDLAMSVYEHAKASGAEIRNEYVKKLEKAGEIFKVNTAKNVYEGKSLLIATGSKHKNLGVPGEKELENKGVSYCALCDGAFFKGKIVCVVGGGDTAAKEALFLSEHASKVYLILRRDILRAEPINAERVKRNEKIDVLYKSEVEEILGTGKVEKIRFKKTEGKFSGKEIPMDGIFLAVGQTPQTDISKDLGVELNDRGEIKIGRKSDTNVPGVFAAGDCTDTGFKQAITGAGEAVIASYYAYHYVNTKAAF
jgi:thioredoxin reductase (NADPH)